MAQQGRYFRPRPKALLGTPYDSMLEKRLHEGALKDFEHHTEKIPYVWPHTYEPDFVLDDLIIESKGYFQDRADCSKYLWIRESLTGFQELVFIFENPDKEMHFQNKRKDGSKMTHGEWCDKNDFRYYSEKNACQVIS
jgi:hypothetical protein